MVSTDPVTCPECLQGKHVNCTEILLDEHDEWVECVCPCKGRT